MKQTKNDQELKNVIQKILDDTTFSREYGKLLVQLPEEKRDRLLGALRNNDIPILSSPPVCGPG